jgi:hypothetical protein
MLIPACKGNEKREPNLCKVKHGPVDEQEAISRGNVGEMPCRDVGHGRPYDECAYCQCAYGDEDGEGCEDLDAYEGLHCPIEHGRCGRHRVWRCSYAPIFEMRGGRVFLFTSSSTVVVEIEGERRGCAMRSKHVTGWRMERGIA